MLLMDVLVHYPIIVSAKIILCERIPRISGQYQIRTRRALVGEVLNVFISEKSKFRRRESRIHTPDKQQFGEILKSAQNKSTPHYRNIKNIHIFCKAVPTMSRMRIRRISSRFVQNPGRSRTSNMKNV
ncbi:unnamed protein product [Nesidiocoris tenuis]|uniref:Uncharacterized protein n=1 Tax=Nesidiocoris tenuis TaxID=355587 RepID=A0A6H5H8V3_9HEMI|nr:unnamed protein product [Nesidiocoris tenuis]CAB0012451.1 unnamed protein product [Nesidiocoris tenuis]